MKNFEKLMSALLLSACVLPAAAQYPTIPDSIKARIERQQAEIDRLSDAAWNKALPIVEQEAINGRPYKPWASRPGDLLKAEIPAFPGAEGGGAYTPGGRWRQGAGGDQPQRPRSRLLP